MAFVVKLHRTFQTLVLTRPLLKIPASGNVLQSRIRLCQSHLKEDEVEELDKLYKTVEIEVKGHDTAVLKSYEAFAEMALNELDVKIANKWMPPRHIKRRTLLKSNFVHRKNLVQYEIRTIFRVIQLKHLTGSTLDTYLEYIQRNLPEGIAMKVTKVELMESKVNV